VEAEAVTPQGSGARSSGDRIWKVVVGCGLAFGLVMLVGFGLALYGLYWAFSPGRQMPTALAVGPRSVGVVRLERGDSDRGMQELVETLIGAIQRAQLAAEDGKVPPFLQSMRRWQLAQSGSNLGMWIPREVTLSIEAGPEAEERRMVAAVNMRSLVRPMGLMIEHMVKREPRARVVTHSGHEVVVSSGGSAVSFAEGTWLFGSGASEVETLLDRWARSPATAPRLPASIEDLGGRFDVYGALQRAEEARPLLALVVAVAGQEERDGSATSGLTGARFGVDARTADEAAVLLELTYESPEAAQEAERTLAGLFSELQARVGAKGAAMDVEPRLEGSRLSVDIGISRLESAIQAWADELVRKED
jgi:hypothetical protein